MTVTPPQTPEYENLMNLMSRHRGLMIAEGILFIILGFLAVALPTFSTMALELFLGWLLLIAAAVQGVRAFQAKKSIPFEGLAASALIYLTIGILLVAFPLKGVLTLTVLMMILYFIQGIAQIVMGFQYRSLERASWLILSGAATLVLAFLIWQGFPETATWVLGLLAGINFIFFGVAILSLGLNAKKLS